MALTKNVSYAADTGLTYTSTEVEFSGGVAKLTPYQAVSPEVWGATLRVAKDYSYGPSFTVSEVGSPVITGNKLDVTGGNDILRIEGAGILPHLVGTVRIKFTPNGAATFAPIFSFKDIDGGNNNGMYLEYNSGTTFKFVTFNSSGSATINSTYNYALSNGTEYQLELCYDFTAGSTQLFVDGLQVFTDATTVTRTDTVDRCSIGGDATYSNAYYRDLEVYNTKQHSAAHAGEIPYAATKSKYITSGSLIIDTAAQSGVGEINTLSSVTSEVDGTIKYLFDVNGQKKYWDGAAWSNSDGTFAQANTLAEVNTNGAELLSVGSDVKVGAVLNSTDGHTGTPTITSNSLNYDFSPSAPASIDECAVYVFIKDILGDDVSITDAKLYATNKKSFKHGESVILPFSKSVPFISDASATISVIETTTPGEEIHFSVVYRQGTALKQVNFKPVIVPNQSTASLTAITEPEEADFG